MNIKHRIRTSLAHLRDTFLWFCVKTLFGKGGFIMMAMFFAQRVILGKTAFADVPSKLKAGCAEILLESGLPELVPTEFGGTATE